MRKFVFLTLSLVLFALTIYAETPAPTTPTANPAEKPAAELATFTVPGLDHRATVKSLTKSLKNQPGILSAQPDAAKGTFAVTFETAKNTPEAILKALVAAVPETKLSGVAPADPKAAKHDCGKCPSKSSCDSHKK